MADYRAPLEEIRFALDAVGALKQRGNLSSASGLEDVLSESAKLAEKVFAPLNMSGDREGCRFVDEHVHTPPGFQRAYSTYADNGWAGASAPKSIGGQGLPFALTIAVSEMLNSANLSLAMGLMPAPGAIELIDRFGSDSQKNYYLPRLVSGQWTVTMAITEPQAGSDLGRIATRAHIENGVLLIKGRKTFITWGDHDLTDNILHLVLARSPDGNAGVNGLSLYLVSKMGLDGAPNDVKCIGLEKKIGLKASPTASLVFGEERGASAELLGKENEGLRQMFVLLNQARLRVAAFALGSAERSRQAAVQYANIRLQGRDAKGQPTVIANHPDVRRMLTSMEARTEAIRLLISFVASFVDDSDHETLPDVAERKALLEMLTPIAKAWCTEVGFDVTSVGMQVFGGVGYTEECEASQYFRESRVHMIYEGTTGVQANDLIFRKVCRDGGAGAKILLRLIGESLENINNGICYDLQLAREELRLALGTLANVTDAIVAHDKSSIVTLQTNGSHYLMFAGTLIACWLTWFAANYAQSEAGRVSAEFRWRKARNARFLVEQFLAPTKALAKTVLSNQQLSVEEGNGRA